MRFGEYDISEVFQIEKSALYHSLGKGISTVEFVLYKANSELLLIEAKFNSPRPAKQMDFNDFIDEIYAKFAHSVQVFFAVVLSRLRDSNNDMPNTFKTIDYADVAIKLLLVIRGHREEWLLPIPDALRKRLRRECRIWKLQLAVINDEIAVEQKLIKQ